MELGNVVGSKGRGNILGGASDTRSSILLLLIGKWTTNQAAFQDVGGEECFRYYTCSLFLGFYVFIKMNKGRIHIVFLMHSLCVYECLLCLHMFPGIY